MEKLTEVLELRDDRLVPLLIILLNEVPLPLVIELLHQTTVPNVLQHLKVGLALHLLIIPNTIEETFRAVLNLHKGPRSILIHLDAVDPPNNLVQSSFNGTDIMCVECVILNEVGFVRISSLVLIPGTMVCVEGLTKVVLRQYHILGCKT